MERQRPERQDPPDGEIRGAKSVCHDSSILPEITGLLSVHAIAHCHAVLVSTPNGRWSRRLYLSLHSADKAMRRAKDRGQAAQCVLVELVPVPGVPVTVVGGDDL